MKIGAEDILLFIGDSITDCSRGRPIGRATGLGEGYVSLVDSLIATCHPECGVNILNAGINGNRVTDLDTRWQTDVLDLTPDWLTVMIGINDVWQQFKDRPASNQVTIDRYETIYRKLLKQTRTSLKGLVLMTPFLIESNLSDPMRERMDAYGRVVQELAREFDAVFVDVQAAFDRYLEHRSAELLCDDRVHPNETGHMIIARSFLSSIEVDWE